MFQAEAEAALKRDREPIDGRPMFVSRCNADKHARESGFKYGTTLEKNKLFVKGEMFSMYELCWLNIPWIKLNVHTYIIKRSLFFVSLKCKRSIT